MKQIVGIFFALAFFFVSSAFAAVDLNTATQAELESLPGIGAKAAEAIISARPFKSVDQLKSVKGIGDKKFDKLQSLVSVGGASAPKAVAAPAAPAAAEPAAPAAPAKKKWSWGGAKDTAAAPAAAKASELAAGERISLNGASQQDLERLPGIGPAKAKAIMEARPFKSLEDVMKVRGIKEGIFAKIKDHISL